MLYVQQNPRLGSDNFTSGIIGHSALALGTVALTFLPTVRVDLMAYLFGDILAVNQDDIAFGMGLAGVVCLVIWRIWRPLLALTVHAELAQVEGVKVWWIEGIYMLLTALMQVMVAMKIVGVLLLTALLIIPAATARQFARTPEQMVLGGGSGFDCCGGWHDNGFGNGIRPYNQYCGLPVVYALFILREVFPHSSGITSDCCAFCLHYYGLF